MIIIGGGLSGLAATFFAHSRKVADKYVLVEATDRFGGWIRTKKDHLNNYYEVGPSCIQCKGEPFIHTLDLINDLKISNHLICSNWPNPESQINAILHHNKIVPLPNTFLDLFKVRTPFGYFIPFSNLKIYTNVAYLIKIHKIFKINYLKVFLHSLKIDKRTIQQTVDLRFC